MHLNGGEVRSLVRLTDSLTANCIHHACISSAGRGGGLIAALVSGLDFMLYHHHHRHRLASDGILHSLFRGRSAPRLPTYLHALLQFSSIEF